MVLTTIDSDSSYNHPIDYPNDIVFSIFYYGDNNCSGIDIIFLPAMDHRDWEHYQALSVEETV
jgi:hypothetical protein